MKALKGAIIVAFVLCAIPSRSLAQLGDVQFVHDPRIIQSDGWFYLYSTGIGIPIRRSKDLINWQFVGPVFAKPPAWITTEYPNARFFWAPDISRLGNEYRLYYAISRFGRNDSRIGLVTNTTLDPQDPKYNWVDRGLVMATHPKDKTHPGDIWNAIDPAIAFDRDQSPWLAMGSFFDGIKLRRINAATGLPSDEDPTLYALARRPRPDAVEAAFIFLHGDFFYLFVSFDFCCRGTNSTYKIMVGRSSQITGPYIDAAGKPMLNGGGTLVLASQRNIIGPGHCSVLHALDQDWLVHHFYDGFNNGLPTLQIRKIAWSADGWPMAGNPIATPTQPANTRP